MITEKNKELVLSLIKDDLLNYRLVSMLNALELDAGNYYTRIGNVVFSLMGFEEDDALCDELYDIYLRGCRKVGKISFYRKPNQLDTLADEIFLKLVEKKNSLAA